MEDKIRTLMDECMPLKTVRISSRDPAWISPLVRSMLIVKLKISVRNKERLQSINSTISEAINENRRKPVAVMGSGDWWKEVVLIFQRRNSSSINLDLDLLERLNDYFRKLCYDEGYKQPIEVQISTKGHCT